MKYFAFTFNLFLWFNSSSLFNCIIMEVVLAVYPILLITSLSLEQRVFNVTQSSVYMLSPYRTFTSNSSSIDGRVFPIGPSHDV